MDSSRSRLARRGAARPLGPPHARGEACTPPALRFIDLARAPRERAWGTPITLRQWNDRAAKRNRSPSVLSSARVTILLRATAETTGGALTIFEEIPPLLDTPLHVHSNEDELFYTLEGEHVVQRARPSFVSDPATLCSCRGGCRTRNGASYQGKAACSSSAPPRGSRISFAILPPRRARAGWALMPTPRRRRGPA